MPDPSLYVIPCGVIIFIVFFLLIGFNVFPFHEDSRGKSCVWFGSDHDNKDKPSPIEENEVSKSEFEQILSRAIKDALREYDQEKSRKAIIDRFHG